MQEIHPFILPCPPPFSTAMSAVDLPDTTSSSPTPYKKPAHRRDTSEDELDVFEAASYYSGEADTSFRSGILPYGNMKEERRTALGGGGMRRSIDVPMMAPLPSQSHMKSEKPPTKEKETKQPISPGGRLASFLNSFFHQGSKKKSKSISAATSSSSTTPQYSCKDGDHSLESPSGRRKRRSSISHSRSTGRSSDSSGASGFRTPSLVFPRGKAKEDPRITSQSNKCSTGVLLQAPPGAVAAASPAATVHEAAFHEGRSCGGYGDLQWERSRRASTNGIVDQKGGCSYHGAKSVVLGGGGGVAEKRWVLNKDSRGIACTDLLRADDGPLAKERSVWKREENEDDGESDSSSDLFELPNCDLVHSFASGLPVYETTSMESIKRGSSMSSVAL